MTSFATRRGTPELSGPGGTRGPFKKAAVGLGIVSMASLVGALVAPASSRADTPGFANGTAQALATSFKVNPTAAQLSVGITFGQSISGYPNQVAKADARGIDLGSI